MKHEWARHPDSETRRMPLQRVRYCLNCETQQQWTSRQEWGRVVGYSWHPLVGKCKQGKVPWIIRPVPTPKPAGAKSMGKPNA